MLTFTIILLGLLIFTKGDLKIMGHIFMLALPVIIGIGSVVFLIACNMK